jgi:ATP phosphoribosyltransferase regulatory subunit
VLIEPRIPGEVLERIRAPFRRLDADGRKAERIDPPVIQPLDLLLDLSGEAMRERLFAVQGENGAEGCLRPDFTIAVARHFVDQGSDSGRFYYQGQAFRMPPPGEAQRHPSEFLQIGLECFGPAGDGAADTEIIALAWEATAAGGRDDLRVRVGDVALFGAVLRDIGVPATIAARLRRAFTRPVRLAAEIKRAQSPAVAAPMTAAQIEAVWAEQGLEPVGGRTAGEIAGRLAERAREALTPRLDDQQAAQIRHYLSLTCPLAETPERLTRFGAGSAAAAASSWWSLRLDGLSPGRIVFDAGFGGPFSYYDGLVFEITSDALGRDAAVAAGGRYDALLTQLAGRPLAAAGCMVRPVRAWSGAPA